MALIDDKLAEIGIVSRERQVKHGKYSELSCKLKTMEIGDLIQINPELRNSVNGLSSRLNIKLQQRNILGTLWICRVE